jgi:hypothetical protein
VEKMEAEFVIGDTLDGCVDKWDERNESQPSRKIKMKIGEESRAASGVCETGHHLGHREQAQLKACG